MGTQIFYIFIEDKLKKVFSFHEENRKGKSMTRVEKVDAVAAQQVKQTKKQDEAKKADDELQTLLGKAGRKARKERREELIDDYLGLGLTKRQATRAAKNQVKNEAAEEKVEKTVVFFDKDEYNAKKDKLKAEGLKAKYIKNRKVRRMIEENPKDFYLTDEKGEFVLDKDGNKIFSSDKYKARIREFTGLDYKQNLDERKAMAKQYDVSKRIAKKAAKYGNFEREKDLTWLYKTGAFVGTVALGATTGAVLKGQLTHSLLGKHIGDGSLELLEKVAASGTAAKGAVLGAITALPAATALAIIIKDNGYPDVFEGLSPEEVVKNGTQGIKGKANRKIVDSILSLDYGNMSPEERDKKIVEKLQEAYGQATGKRVNERELIAAYEHAKKEIEEVVIDDDDDDDVDPDPGPGPGPGPDPDPIEICDYQVKPQEGKEPNSYTIKYGDYPSGIIMDMYGVKYNTPEYKEIRDAVYAASNYKRNTNLKVGDKFTLPDVQVGEKVYKPIMENKDKVRTDKVVNNGLSLGRTNKVVKSADKYYVADCKGYIKYDEVVNGSTDREAVQARVDELNKQQQAELEEQMKKQQGKK